MNSVAARVSLVLFGLQSSGEAFFGVGVRRIEDPQLRVVPVSNDDLFWHSFSWLFPRNTGVLDDLETSRRPGDFYYVITGDSQYWFHCTPTNLPCHAATNYCERNASIKDCSKQQNNWANRVQHKSIRALVTKMQTRGIRPKGLIINGDLTDYGHHDEFRAYKHQFGRRFLRGVPMYPGLGNHDYANNVDDCFGNNCAQRMCNELVKVVGSDMRLDVDVKTRKGPVPGDDWVSEVKTGSLAYSWDQCNNATEGAGPGCVHFVQLHNYPTYSTAFTAFWSERWEIRPSLDWLRRDLAANAGKPVLINFHDFDTHFDEAGKAAFRDVLSASNATILGIFFAHIHSNVGLHPTSHWCIRGRAVPLLYSGSIPGSNFLLARLNPAQGVIPALYVLNVRGDNETKVSETQLPRNC